MKKLRWAILASAVVVASPAMSMPLDDIELAWGATPEEVAAKLRAHSYAISTMPSNVPIAIRDDIWFKEAGGIVASGLASFCNRRLTYFRPIRKGSNYSGEFFELLEDQTEKYGTGTFRFTRQNDRISTVEYFWREPQFVVQLSMSTGNVLSSPVLGFAQPGSCADRSIKAGSKSA